MVLGLRQKVGIAVFIETAPAAKLLSWQQPLRCHFVSCVIHIYGAKFQEHCLNTFRVIVYLVFYYFLSCKSYDAVTDLICILQKCQYL